MDVWSLIGEPATETVPIDSAKAANPSYPTRESILPDSWIHPIRLVSPSYPTRESILPDSWIHPTRLVNPSYPTRQSILSDSWVHPTRLMGSFDQTCGSILSDFKKKTSSDSWPYIHSTHFGPCVIWIPWPRKYTHEQFHTKIRREITNPGWLQQPPWL